MAESLEGQRDCPRGRDPEDPGMVGVLTDEAVDKVDLAVALSNKLRGWSMVDSRRRSPRMLSLFHWRNVLGAHGR